MAASNKTKKILVTAGPVWVPIDSVRVMTNIFTGTLGFLIAKAAAKKGFEVTLLLGPGLIVLPKKLPSRLEVARFRYFNELYDGIEKRVASGKYDVMIHTAAVPDYVPRQVVAGKIKSGREDFSLAFKPTPKIVDLVKKWDSDICLVKFKLEAGMERQELLDKAYKAMVHSNADMIVANDLSEMESGGHKAYIIDRRKNIIECEGKNNIAKKLVSIISEKYS